MPALCGGGDGDAARSLLDHLGHDHSEHVGRSREVGVDLVAPVVVVHLGNGPERLDAGVRERDVDSSEAAQHRPHACSQGVDVALVDDVGHPLLTGRLDQSACPGQVLARRRLLLEDLADGTGDVEPCDARALSRHGYCGGTADASSGTRDEGDLAGQAARTVHGLGHVEPLRGGAAVEHDAVRRATIAPA